LLSSKVNPRKRGSEADSLFKCLAGITAMHKVDPRKFFNSLVEAWNQGRSKCEPLEIACREKRKDSAVFLFTLGSDVVAQLPIPTEILEGQNVLEEYVAAIPVRAERAQKSVDLKIMDLKPRMTGVNLRAKVVEIATPKTVHNGPGILGVVSNVLIGDETGTIRMVLWNRQIDKVSEGVLIEIKNARVESFRGELLLRVGKGGKIEIDRGRT
jgi:replication factor A1